MSINVSFLSGKLGKDPELKYTQSGIPVARFSVATSEWKRNRDGSGSEETDWHNIVAWNKDAQNASKYLKKGQEVTIVGRSRTRKYTDRNNIERSVTEVHVKKITYHGRSNQNQQRSQDNYSNNSGASSDTTPPARQEHYGQQAESRAMDNIDPSQDIPF